MAATIADLRGARTVKSYAKTIGRTAGCLYSDRGTTRTAPRVLTAGSPCDSSNRRPQLGRMQREIVKDLRPKSSTCHAQVRKSGPRHGTARSGAQNSTTVQIPKLLAWRACEHA